MNKILKKELKESLVGIFKVLQICEGGRSADVTEDYTVQLGYKTFLTIPKGFHTDFISSPRWTWSIIPPWGKSSPAAVVHDYFYSTGKCTQKEADKMFLKLLKVLDVIFWRRQTMYWILRFFGHKAWEEHREKENKNI